MRAASTILTASIVIGLSGCQVWKVSPPTPIGATELQGNPRLVRLTLNNSSSVMLESPRIYKDSIYGLVRTRQGDATGDRVAFSLDTIRQVDEQHVSPGRTAALLAGMAGTAVIAFYGAIFILIGMSGGF
jgi:hypothetical protein